MGFNEIENSITGILQSRDGAILKVWDLDMLRTLNDFGTQVLDNQISYFYQDDNGDDVSRERLTLQYEDSDNVLVKIVKGTIPIKEVKDKKKETEGKFNGEC